MITNQDLKLTVAELRDSIAYLRKQLELTKTAYQVFKGEEDKHGHQRYDLLATYFDEAKALEHCEQVVEADEFKNEQIGVYDYPGGRSWTAVGWSYVTICELRKIEIM